MFDYGMLVLGGANAVAVGAAVVHVRRRRRREAEASEVLAENEERGARVPLTLHPVIDSDLCIGSLGCLSACPEGDILGLVNGVAQLIHPDRCIGHGECAAQCPVGAIKLVFGTSERGVDLPVVDRNFESNRPGVHIVGELGGMGLIKNAITQGLQVSAHIAEAMPKGRGGANGTVDVAIVGGGPAGLATALGLKEKGLTFRVLEQGSLGGTIANYPRQKVVMTEPADIPFYGKLNRRKISKEDLLAAWQQALGKAGVRVDEGVRVEGIEGEDGAFRVLTTKGAVPARKVVLATGVRGTPRKLGVPGEDLPKVSYNLTDPEQYEGARVLVVGGGDAALEAAIQLAEEGGAEVTLSYRGDSFSRVRAENRSHITALGAKGLVRLLMNSEVDKVLEKEVVLTASGSPVVLENDFVIVSIGGELPVKFLTAAGISLQKHFGEERGKAKAPAAVPSRRGIARADQRKALSRSTKFYLATSALIICWLAAKGWGYYILPKAERLNSPLHATLRPAGTWGHGVGIVATAIMLLNLLYPFRKRLSFLSRAGSIKGWLDFHVFVGILCPIVIAFHAAFQSNNQLATATASSLLTVVLTGIFGRYVYGFVPSSNGKEIEQKELLKSWEQLKARMEPLIGRAPGAARLRRTFDSAAKPARTGTLLGLLLRMPLTALTVSIRLRMVRSSFADPEDYELFSEGYSRLHRLRLQVGFYRALKGLMRTWRLFHAVVACFLVLAITAHIAVSLYLGYGLTG
ncbi:MAG: NAD(P)-binding domain-containing protein [Myxococcales bacterium]